MSPVEWTDQIKHIRRLTTTREPLSVRAVRLAVRVLVGIGLLVVLALMVGGVWVIWAMGGVE